MVDREEREACKISRREHICILSCASLDASATIGTRVSIRNFADKGSIA